MALTNDEAIKILAVNGWGFTDGELKEATQMAMHALKEKSEAEEYRTPTSPIAKKRGKIDEWYCPKCDQFVSAADLLLEYDFCPNCGQALTWDGVNKKMIDREVPTFEDIIFTSKEEP